MFVPYFVYIHLFLMLIFLLFPSVFYFNIYVNLCVCFLYIYVTSVYILLYMHISSVFILFPYFQVYFLSICIICHSVNKSFLLSIVQSVVFMSLPFVYYAIDTLCIYIPRPYYMNYIHNNIYP